MRTGRTAAADRLATGLRAIYRERYPDFWAESNNGYAATSVASVDSATAAAIRDAAARAWRVYAAIAPLLATLPDATLREMGIPDVALPLMREPLDLTATLARFDFAFDGTSYRVLELNADTPFFLWESFAIADDVARAAGMGAPNAGQCAVLERALARAVGAGAQRIAVTANNAYREDWYTARFVQACLERALGRTVALTPLHDLRVDRRGAFDETGRIDVLYRLYPTECFARDAGGALLFEAVRGGRLRLLNAAAALLLQTKMTHVLIWGLAERGEFFSPDDCAAIRATFLPTYAEQPDDDATYAVKPILGREGGGIRIVRGGTVLHESPDHRYENQPVVYQRYVPLPEIHYCDTAGRPAIGRAVTTCFIAGGEPSAIGLRAGGLVTDGTAHFVPTGHPR